MNTFLSAAQENLKENYNTFASEVVAPAAVSLEAHESSLADFLLRVGEAGYLGLTVPQEYGGQARQFLDAALFIEAVSQFNPGLGLTLANHIAVIELVERYGSDQQKSRYLPLLAKGETIGALAFHEEAAGSDLGAVASAARLDGNQYHLSGKKTWVVNGEIAHLLVVLARVADKGDAALFLVDRTAKGLACGPVRKMLGLHSACANDVVLENVSLDADAALLGGQAAEKLDFVMDVAKVLIAASAVGLAQRCLDVSLEHARTREQFGQTIGQFQAVQWKIADHATEATGARLLTYRAAWSKGESPRDFHKHAAMCKWFASRMARIYSGEALQILGASGLEEGSPLERFYRDGKVMEIAGGTSEMQKVALVGELDI